jgi:Zn finger protein HypA/HybF involved in hydrogenase expression
MNEFDDILDAPSEETEVKELHFSCPNCGKISQDDVVFLCNTCDSKKMILKDGVYICPECLTKHHKNFMCMNCDSKDVKLLTDL